MDGSHTPLTLWYLVTTSNPRPNVHVFGLGGRTQTTPEETSTGVARTMNGPGSTWNILAVILRFLLCARGMTLALKSRLCLSCARSAFIVEVSQKVWHLPFRFQPFYADYLHFQGLRSIWAAGSRAHSRAKRGRFAQYFKTGR